MSNTTETIPQKQTASAQAPADLWQAIRTIISLQNQAPPLIPTSREQNLPLSFTQERLWLIDQLESGSSTAYNIPLALRLSGSLNISALEQSLKEIVRRHEALRTTFSTVENKPVQIISSEDQNWSLTIQNLQELPKVEREQEALRLSIQEAQKPFDISSDLLFRASLLELEPEENILLISVHHIVFDGWSEGMLWQELTSLYESFVQGESSPLPKLSIQYADFAVWQRQWLQSDFLAALRSYWQEKLGANLPDLTLPTDYSPPAVPTRKSSTHKLTISAPLTAELKQLSYQSGATLFATLLTAFKILLYVYTEQEDLFVCSPIANRNRPELKQLMGYFVNLLILRSDLSGNPSVQELLNQVRQTVTGSYAHQDFPLQQLVQDLGLGQKSLSQVMFVLQNNEQNKPNLSGLAVETLDIDNGKADFDLSLSLTECQDELVGVWKYNTDLFSPESIAKMAEDWQTLLEKIVADPTKPISELLVLSNRDRQQLRAKRTNNLSVPGRSSSKSTNNSKPRNALELRLTELWSEILDNQDIHLQDNFFEIGGSSLLAFRLIGEIESSFGKKLPLSALLEAPTVEKLAKLISENGDTNSSSWLNPPQPGSSRPTLFCIPPAGNSLLGFANLVRHLGKDQPFYVPQPLGLEGETEPHERVEDMAAHYIKEIRAIQPVGPYYLGGRCFGGIVAFEMARQLSQQGQKVGLLALIDGGMPPNIYSKLRNTNGSQKTKTLAEYWQSFAYFCRNGQLLTILEYKYRKQLRKLKAKFLPSQAAPDPLMANVKKVFRSHLKARAKYLPTSSYPGKITIFASGTLRLDQQASWEELATEGIDCHFVGGSHGTIDQEPHVGVLAGKLRACLDEAQQKTNVHI
ncbi:condensation domain-containing protein [Pleurocapsa sp. PCC 7319]|uniref:condensation domain-containing protein n=1 Tax=Pleurocapsa sp. PCC 7319 TaxID=118161 RepID=UPI000345D03D|nr:condensation domain-containing protein [Pleurocapsa sp. PCC 7319]